VDWEGGTVRLLWDTELYNLGGVPQRARLGFFYLALGGGGQPDICLAKATTSSKGGYGVVCGVFGTHWNRFDITGSNQVLRR